MQLRKGDRVRITGTLDDDFDGVNLSLLVDGCKRRSVIYPVSPEGIEIIEPEGWPPRMGDVWRTGSTEYFVIDIPALGLVLQSDDGLSRYRKDGLSAFRARHPELVRRRTYEPDPEQ